MLKTIISAILAVAVLFSLNSKDIYKNDISNRLIIQGIGIDIDDDDKYNLTIQAINTSTHTASLSDSGDETVKIYKVKGETIYKAIKSAIEYEGKIPMYSQNRVIVIGKNIAEKGIAGIVDFLSRDVDNGPSVLVAMAENSAEEIMSFKIKGEVVARNIDFALRSADYEAEIYKLQIYELINRYKGTLCSFAMPVVSLKNQSEDKKTVEVTNTAIFNDGKLSGYLTRQETIMYNFLSGSLYNGEISFSNPQKRKISLNIAESKTKRDVKIKNDKPYFNININLKVDLAEIYDGINSNMNKEELNKIKRQGEEYLKVELQKLISKLYGNNVCDAPGLSRLIFIKYPKFFRTNKNNLNTVLRNSSYNIEITMCIRRIGHDYIKSS